MPHHATKAFTNSHILISKSKPKIPFKLHYHFLYPLTHQCIPVHFSRQPFHFSRSSTIIYTEEKRTHLLGDPWGDPSVIKSHKCPSSSVDDNDRRFLPRSIVFILPIFDIILMS
ncbi:hypothetical protein JTE90_022260 [Oedothorax gibbosus]|uniref:Uncharacterized protein n=1 Tax=Oedothorax gibbosus TaxID=931172 RepID=A0AAV6VWP1_9ARAC|nr:hypothetical protein JTE90_022260 [Oedothorax gibbosus]